MLQGQVLGHGQTITTTQIRYGPPISLPASSSSVRPCSPVRTADGPVCSSPESRLRFELTDRAVTQEVGNAGSVLHAESESKRTVADLRQEVSSCRAELIARDKKVELLQEEVESLQETVKRRDIRAAELELENKMLRDRAANACSESAAKDVRIADLASAACKRLDEIKALQAEATQRKAADAKELERKENSNWRLEAEVLRLQAEVGQSAARLDDTLANVGMRPSPQKSFFLQDIVDTSDIEERFLQDELVQLRSEAVQAGRDVEMMAAEVARLQERAVLHAAERERLLEELHSAQAAVGASGNRNAEAERENDMLRAELHECQSSAAKRDAKMAELAAEATEELKAVEILRREVGQTQDDGAKLIKSNAEKDRLIAELRVQVLQLQDEKAHRAQEADSVARRLAEMGHFGNPTEEGSIIKTASLPLWTYKDPTAAPGSARSSVEISTACGSSAAVLGVQSSISSPGVGSSLKPDSCWSRTAERKAASNRAERSRERADASPPAKIDHSPTQRLVQELAKDHAEHVRTTQAQRLFRDLSKDRELVDLREENVALRSAKNVEDLLVFALEADENAMADDYRMRLERERDLRAELEAKSLTRTREAEADARAEAQAESNLMRRRFEDESRARDATLQRVVALRDSAQLHREAALSSVGSRSPPTQIRSLLSQSRVASQSPPPQIRPLLSQSRVASQSPPPSASKGNQSKASEVLRNLRRIVASCRSEQVSAISRNERDLALRVKSGQSQ